MNYRRFLMLFFLLFLAIFSVSGLSCRKKTQTTTPTLTVWLVGYKKTNFERKLSSFKSKQKVNINLEEKEKDTLEEDLINALATHQGPDIVMIDHDFLIKHKEIFAPCVLKITKNQIQYCDIKGIKDYYPPIVQILVWDNKLYGYPYYISTPLVLYNTKIITDSRQELYRNNLSATHIPYYWDEFVKLAKILTKKDAKGKIIQSGVALGTASNNPVAQDILYSLMLQNGTKISNPESANPLALFNLPTKDENGNLVYPGEKALNFYTSFSNPQSKNYSFNSNFGSTWREFAQGKVAMIIDYPERIEDIQSLNPSISIRQSIFPQITNTENPTVYGKVYLFGILKDSKNIVLAWKLAGELTKFWNESFVKKATKEKDWRFKTEGNEALKTQINFAQTVYKYKYPEEFDKNIREAIDNVSTKKASSQKALDKAATSINQLVIENGATY